MLVEIFIKFVLNKFLEVTKIYWIPILLFFLCSCEHLGPALPEAEEVLAEPMAGLTSSELNQHILGDQEFARVFATEDGLGPIFVSNSCESCHMGDGKGHLITNLTRFGRLDGSSFDPMTEFGGPQLQQFSIPGYAAESIPSGITGSAEFMAPLVTGLGLVNALHDSTLINLADPNDLDNDGISGNLGLVTLPDFLSLDETRIGSGGFQIGRFGRKATAIDLIHQTANAYLNDMGITSDMHVEDLVNPLDANTSDLVADPEVSGAVVDLVAFYLATLKAPTRRNSTDGQVLQGEALFAQIGCESCHVSALTTAANVTESLNEVTFYPYSDFLLHDMGSGLDDGYTEGSASTSEWRTTPLWGTGLSSTSQGGQTFFLHDGRAHTLDDAIQYHGGEATTSTANYNSLSTTEKEALIQFLESL